MPWTIPDKGEGLHVIQSITFQEDLEVAITDPALGNYVRSGLVVAAQGSPNMTVQVTAGVAYSNGYRFPVAASASLAISAADATNPRIDYVVVTSAGVLAVRAGTPVAYVAGTSAPKPPVRTLNDVVIAQVYVPAADTTIDANQIYDRRFILPDLSEFQAETGIWDRVIHAVPVAGTTAPNVRGDTVVSNGTITHPAPATTNRVTQLQRTRFANIAATANQPLGITQSGNVNKFIWRGNAAGLGGFYFRGKMPIELWPAATVRYFLGSSSGAANVVASDTLAGDICGLWHDTTMGASVLNFITRDNVTTNTIAIPLATAMAAGQGYELIMYCKPNDTILYYKVIDMLTGNTLADSFTSTNLPRNTQFMGIEAQMSNGTANVTTTTVAPGIVEVFCGSPAIRS